MFPNTPLGSNQIETLLGILVRRLLKTDQFYFVDDLRQRIILSFIEYFNRTLQNRLAGNIRVINARPKLTAYFCQDALEYHHSCAGRKSAYLQWRARHYC